MPNPTDQDRINDTTRGGVVVNLDEYRAQAGTRSTAQPFLGDAAQTSVFLAALFLVVVALAFFHAILRR